MLTLNEALKIAGLPLKEEKSHKFIIVDEGHWDDEDDNGVGYSDLDIYVVSDSELATIKGANDLDNASAKVHTRLADALRSGKIGKKSGKGRISNPDPDTGSEGVVGPRGVTLIFPEL